MSVDPLITVLMPLYNAERYVRQAIESILCQTWRDFELLIIDDGSTDAGPDIVAAMHDERLVLLRNPNNMGVAATLNRGLDVARGRYIARMDADDISLPDRLERQVRFMEENPDVGISGGWVRCFGTSSSSTQRPPCEQETLRCYALFENPFCHMAVIMRREMMQVHDLRYDGSFSRSEDYELWSRALYCFPLANIGRVLVRARQHPASVTLTHWQEMTLQTEKIQAVLLRALNINPLSEELRLHHQVGRGYRQREIDVLRKGEQWLLHLCQCNQEVGFANNSIFAAVAGRIWLSFCINSAQLGQSAWRCWRSSPLKDMYAAPLKDELRFVASILWHMLRPRRIPEHLSAGEARRCKEHLQ